MKNSISPSARPPGFYDIMSTCSVYVFYYGLTNDNLSVGMYLVFVNQNELVPDDAVTMFYIKTNVLISKMNDIYTA